MDLHKVRTQGAEFDFDLLEGGKPSRLFAGVANESDADLILAWKKVYDYLKPPEVHVSSTEIHAGDCIVGNWYFTKNARWKLHVWNKENGWATFVRWNVPSARLEILELTHEDKVWTTSPFELEHPEHKINGAIETNCPECGCKLKIEKDL